MSVNVILKSQEIGLHPTFIISLDEISDEWIKNLIYIFLSANIEMRRRRNKWSGRFLLWNYKCVMINESWRSIVNQGFIFRLLQGDLNQVLKLFFKEIPIHIFRELITLVNKFINKILYWFIRLHSKLINYLNSILIIIPIKGLMELLEELIKWMNGSKW